ncbi:MAG TPA: hypothetical protein VLS89_13800, partial [Candidatus Nanopelagicales bacterium]|nr:hypothetical protein [Candidatus Nanopelagicales bacterium]
LGGVDAHLVLEEPEPATPSADGISDGGPEIVPLSARDRDRLLAYARALVAFLERRLPARGPAAGTDQDLLRFCDVVYTLQVGRPVFDARLAVVAHDPDELLARLRAFTAGQTSTTGIFENDARDHREVTGLFGADEQGRFAQMLRAGQAQRLAALWAMGCQVDWEALRPRGGRRRIPLPTYPFAKERYWLSELPSRSTTAEQSMR